MNRLRELTARLLDVAASQEELTQTCADLHAWFVQTVPLQVLADVPMQLPGGLALAPGAAAQCIFDTLRTVRFVRGVALALDEARRRFPHEAIEVVYAGSGPYAPLLLPLLSLRPLHDVRLTLLDCHQPAIDSLHVLLARLGLESAVQVVHCDAACYTHERPIHLVVTETLQRALAREPFLPIVRNLRGQLAPSGLLVPERVTVGAALVDAAAEQRSWIDPAQPRQHEYLGLVFEVTLAGEHPLVDASGRSQAVSITLPDWHSDGERWLALITRIDVFGDQFLGDNESGLTVPEILWPLAPVRTGDVIRFQYVLDSNPGVRSKRIPDPGEQQGTLPSH